MTVNKALVKDVSDAKETMWLMKVKPSHKPAKGISHTVYPDDWNFKLKYNG
jgi:hypothetical protein